jgi:hypothetical protein
MNNGSGNRPGRLRPGPNRTAVLGAALAVVALLSAACGGSSSPSNTGQTYYQKTLAYAQCMRAHGAPGFPDPNSQGNFLINGQKDHISPQLMAKANKACQHLLPGGGVLTPAQLKQATAQALKLVACMRAHGLPNMPDPQVVNGQIYQRLGGASPTLFQSAQHACQRFTPAGPP